MDTHTDARAARPTASACSGAMDGERAPAIGRPGKRVRVDERSRVRVEHEDAAVPMRRVPTGETRESSRSSAVAVGGLASNVVLRTCGKPRNEYAASGPSGGG